MYLSERYMGTTFCNEAAVESRRKKLEKIKSSKGANILYEQHEHTSHVLLPSPTTTHTHTYTYTTYTHTPRTNRMFCYYFFKLGDTVWNTVWNYHISTLHIYIKIQSHMYQYDF